MAEAEGYGDSEMVPTMRIYTKAGDLAFSTFTFPDGQPHFKLETYELDFTSVTVEMSIKSPTDLLTAVMVSGVLREHGYSEVNLDIRYLLGARMDRAISSVEPFTLQYVSRILNSAGFNRVRILDVHSEVATRLIRNSVNVLPKAIVKSVMTTLSSPMVIIPDKGATQRVKTLAEAPHYVYLTQAYKKRDMETGKLSGFGLESTAFIHGSDCLIIDDICDGGGTFTGLAKVLREAGAKKVFLFVTHGIFSKGPHLDGIDHTYTTDSVAGRYMGGVTTIPISMKELK